MTGISRIISAAKSADTGSHRNESVTERDSSFSRVLSEKLEQDLKEKAITITSPSLSDNGIYGGLINGTGAVEMLLANAARSGNMGDAETALFLACIMMQSMNSSEEMSAMLGVISPLISNLKGDISDLKGSIMQSDFSPYILSRLDISVFKSSIPPQISPTGRAIVPSEAWKPTSPAIVSTPNDRSPQKLRLVIDQFNVETSERYRPYRRERDTYCNIFLWDVTNALNCEIPHFVDPVTGNPRKYPDIEGAIELGAVQIEDWLVKYGGAYGWREVDAATAQDYAHRGKPAVTTAGSIGHVQVVCPSNDGKFDPILGVTVAQAGSRNTGYTHISRIYDSVSLSKIRYFVHE
jgi:hypothetical protein